MKRDEFEKKIVQRAWDDPDFKKKLLDDPKAAINDELGKIQEGVSVPDNVKVHIHEETPGEIHVTLPRNPKEILGAAPQAATTEGAASTAVVAVTDMTTVTQVIDNAVAVALMLDVTAVNVTVNVAAGVIS